MKRAGITAALAALLVGAGSLRADDQTEMRALVEKAIKAHGGAEALEKDAAGTIKAGGKFYGMGEGLPYTMTLSYQRPDKVRVDIDVEVMGKTFKFLQVVNGDKAWVAFDGNVTEVSKEGVAALRQQRYEGEIVRLVPLRDKAFKLSPLGEAKVEGRPAVGVRVQHEGREDVNLFFDKETSLLLKTEGRGRDPMNPDQEFAAETFFGDYKKSGDRVVPHKTTLKRDGKLYVESEVTEVTTVPKHDDSLFAKP
jgi:hypothetical protein